MVKNIVIVGAGYAGVTATHQLAQQLEAQSEYQVVLLDDHPFFTYRTSLHEVAAKRIESSDVQFDLRQLFMHQKNVKIVTTHVEQIDVETKTLTTSVGPIEYEQLIWSSGVEAKTTVPGVAEYGFPFWSLDQATRLRVQIEEMVRQGAIELEAKERQAKLRLVVVGGNNTGIQMLGELLDERRVLAKANQLRQREIELVLVEKQPQILASLADKRISQKVANYLKHQGVKIYLHQTVETVTAEGVVLNDGTQLMSRTVIWAGGTQGRQQVTNLSFTTNEQQHVEVDALMQVQGLKDVYAVGDAIQKADNRLSNVNTAVQEAKVAAHNIQVKVRDKGELQKMKPAAQRIFISVGSRYGVAVWKSHLAMTGFLARHAKHWSNLYFLRSIGSFYQMVKYIQREIFESTAKLPEQQGNVANVGNILWSVPLRLATGVFLMITGVAVGSGVGGFFALVGIALFIGFMTTLAGFLTLILSLIMLGTSFSISALLLPFVGIALMNGAGRSFGVDHWLIPWLEKNLGTLITGDSKASYNDLAEK
ncbi:hypothetical protein IV73_GL000997 [Weissella kandleri]|uniref:NADH:ubiquinone reductase (non-electrogenic) n=1 Tax=Weissella kandleri TaxID=1616 RepID=A0A0R2JKG0_9LACO|nr:FAD-dependent oxidoreductase [Weissella kandleri]KRN74874.1 hypothetical protein IV73_GL000997 [Weissella kandleri]